MFAGFVMIAYSSSTPIAGLAERISAAMPAAAGAAALVPWNVREAAERVVATPSGAAMSGFCSTSGVDERGAVRVEVVRARGRAS